LLQASRLRSRFFPENSGENRAMLRNKSVFRVTGKSFPPVVPVRAVRRHQQFDGVAFSRTGG
jgi:hypothetical protein